MKRCSKCKTEKALIEFSFQNKKTGKLMSHCKSCRNSYNREYRHIDIVATRKKDKERYKKNAERRREYAREYRRKYPERTRATNWKVNYGITPEYFYGMLKEQDNKCAICGRDMDDYGKIFCVDHNHKSGKVRGLLCDPCNYGIGFYEKHKDKYKVYLSKYDLQK